ncbi:hypothetical protein BDV59DRAFT_85628 [Aspergillus ambiguus]|uniref:uncharacterized protein n=1 Tax=Aspergillus ambiguus TaxID=176160 RepID=UPI003CCE3675
MHRFYLSVMLVNTTGIGTMPSATTGHPERARADNDHPPPHDDGVHSVFGAADTSLFPSLLMRTMDQGIDSHLLMSTVKGAHVVEVMKDRVGENTGKWSVWKPGQ